MAFLLHRPGRQSLRLDGSDDYCSSPRFPKRCGPASLSPIEAWVKFFLRDQRPPYRFGVKPFGNNPPSLPTGLALQDVLFVPPASICRNRTPDSAPFHSSPAAPRTPSQGVRRFVPRKTQQKKPLPLPRLPSQTQSSILNGAPGFVPRHGEQTSVLLRHPVLLGVDLEHNVRGFSTKPYDEATSYKTAATWGRTCHIRNGPAC